ncbi:hypothetical protein BG011_001716 [Mortierella polycephala]|uniref:Uncharacterized protein n=1 Tax=Mortierella polycephala TaxID=41804 RepID=A0A9P6U605_9FUNG|nr:hypothetical protein BG011_001716 [Mortierella polycephala]
MFASKKIACICTLFAMAASLVVAANQDAVPVSGSSSMAAPEMEVMDKAQFTTPEAVAIGGIASAVAPTAVAHSTASAQETVIPDTAYTPLVSKRACCGHDHCDNYCCEDWWCCH